MESNFSILSAVPDHRKGNHLVYPPDYSISLLYCTYVRVYNPAAI